MSHAPLMPLLLTEFSGVPPPSLSAVCSAFAALISFAMTDPLALLPHPQLRQRRGRGPAHALANDEALDRKLVLGAAIVEATREFFASVVKQYQPFVLTAPCLFQG